MQKIRIKKIIDLFIEIFYLSIIFLVPVYFALFYTTNDIFELNKIIVFKMLVWILLFFTITKLLFNIDYLFWSINKIDYEALISNIRNYSRNLFAPVLFIFSIVLSVFFSVDLEISVYGLYERQQGLVTIIFYILFFGLLLININNKAQIRRVLYTILLSSIVVSIYGLVQAAGIDPLDWSESTSLRIISTFGQPNFLASWLLLSIPINIFLFIKNKKIYSKFFLLFILFFQLVCLIFTYSRGGWIGFVGGSILFWGIYFIKLKKRNVCSLLKYLIISIILFFVVIIGLKDNQVFKSRFDVFSDIKSGSIAARRDIWLASINAIKKRPLVGYGPETQKQILVKYYEKDWAIHSFANVEPSRAHNFFLDIMLTNGVIGLITYLTLLLWISSLCIRNIRQGSILSLFLLYALFCYLISLLVSFSVTATEVYFWLYFALVIKISCLHLKSKKIEQQGTNNRKDTLLHTDNYTTGGNIQRVFRQYHNFILGFVIIFFLIFTIIQENKELKYLIADYYFRNILVERNNNNFIVANNFFNLIKGLEIRDNYYQMEYAIILSGWNDNKYNVNKILLDIATNIRGDSYKKDYARARIYSTLANKEEQNYYDLAEEYYKKVIHYSPEIPENYRNLAQMYLQKGDYSLAIKNYNIALSMLPSVNSPGLNKSHREKIQIEKYLTYLGLGGTYYQMREYKRTINYYLLAIENNKSDTRIYYEIAEIYKKLGKNGLSQEYIEKIKNL